jgi:transcriptional accessory protein Tex/SPT6
VDWKDKLISLYPDWTKEEGIERFNNSNHGLKIGDEVMGTVICRTQFGVWVDINVGYPAVILLTNFASNNVKLDGFIGFPQVGSTVKAVVQAIGIRAEIGLIEKGEAE